MGEKEEKRERGGKAVNSVGSDVRVERNETPGLYVCYW